VKKIPNHGFKLGQRQKKLPGNKEVSAETCRLDNLWLSAWERGELRIGKFSKTSSKTSGPEKKFKLRERKVEKKEGGDTISRPKKPKPGEGGEKVKKGGGGGVAGERKNTEGF